MPGTSGCLLVTTPATCLGSATALGRPVLRGSATSESFKHLDLLDWTSGPFVTQLILFTLYSVVGHDPGTPIVMISSGSLDPRIDLSVLGPNMKWCPTSVAMLQELSQWANA